MAKRKRLKHSKSNKRDYQSLERDSLYQRRFALLAAREAERVLSIFEKEHPADDPAGEDAE
jgi:hypothetical protein